MAAKKKAAAKKPPLGSGARFQQVQQNIQKQGKSKKAAQAIAASIGQKKFGAKKMASMAAAGRKKGGKRG